ncbi:MAG: hypothetical protein ACREFX_02960 [Opitutaceae bacterium]
MSAEFDVGALLSLPLGDRPLRRLWGVARARSRPLERVEEIFVGFCGTAAEALGLGAPSPA